MSLAVLFAAIGCFGSSIAHAADQSLQEIDAAFGICAGPYEPTRQSILKHECPDWFRDAKFGIYMHWGLNSVPGYNGHYARCMYHQHPPAAYLDPKTRDLSGFKPGYDAVYRFHVKHFGHPSKFGYKDFIPMWKPDKFDPVALAKFYKSCGARYIGAMAVHHDNFDLYDSKYHRWNSVQMGPHIDVVGQWKQACRTVGLPFAVSTHLSNNSHEHRFYQGESDTTGPLAGVPYDTMDPANEGLYGKRSPDRLRRINPDFANQWFLRTKQLISDYQPDLLYFDGALPHGELGRKIAAHYFNTMLNSGETSGVLTVKLDPVPLGLTPDKERAHMDHLSSRPWQVDTSINKGWFYLPGILGATQVFDGAEDAGGGGKDHPAAPGDDPVQLTGGQIIDNLCDIVSKNGNMMLNVGLRPDGSLPESYREQLKIVGAWLNVNGEAIYETRPWKVYGEGSTRVADSTEFNDHLLQYTDEDVRFTTRGDTVYAILLDWPQQEGEFIIRSLGSAAAGEFEHAQLLATGDDVSFRQSSSELGLTLPAKKPGDHAFVVMLTR